MIPISGPQAAVPSRKPRASGDDPAVGDDWLVQDR